MNHYNLPKFRIDKNEFLKGNNTYDELPDGAFISTDNGMNVFGKPGMLTVPAGSTGPSTGLPAVGMINYGKGKGTLTLNGMAVGTNSSGDGYFYTITDSTGAHTQVGSADTAKDYDIGKSDTVYYQGAFYTSSTTDLTKNDITLVTRDVSFWVTTKGKSALDANSPHPLKVFGDILYLANGRYLHSLDGATATEMVFDMGPDWIIIALDVYGGQLRIIAEPYYNYSGIYHGLTKMVTWEGTTDHWLDEWDINYRISATYVFDSVLYMWTKDYMGYWNGQTFKPLRKMSGQIYKHQITEVDNSLFFADGVYIVRYGTPLFSGSKRFFTMWQLSTAVAGLVGYYGKSLIASISGASSSTIFYASDVNTPSSSGLYEWTLNPREFDRPVRLRMVLIKTDALTSGQYVIAKYLDDKNTEYTAATFDYTTYGGKSVKEITFNGGRATSSIRPRIRINGSVYLRSITFFYEPSEVLIT